MITLALIKKKNHRAKSEKNTISMTAKSRAWTLTIHGLADDFDFSPAFTSFVAEHGARYCCAQWETCPTSGRRHIQAYVYWRNQHRLSSLREIIHSHFGVFPHAEIARGSPEQNRQYCSKPETAVVGSFKEFGEIPRKGRRGDLDEIGEMCKSESLDVIADSFPSQFIRYHRGIAALQQLKMCRHRDPSVPVHVEWWFGPTGTGKSRAAFELFPSAYVKMNNKWWDGYLAQETVIIDDYRPSLCTFQEFLRILDRYPMRVEVKGGSVPLAAVRFIITTTKRPEVIWEGRTEEALNQLLRRIAVIKDFSVDPPVVLKDSSTIYHPLPPSPIVDGFNLPPPRRNY